MTPRTPGVGVDNSDTVYQFDTNSNLSPEEQALNDTVARIAADLQGRHPNGLSQMPVIAATSIFRYSHCITWVIFLYRSSTKSNMQNG